MEKKKYTKAEAEAIIENFIAKKEAPSAIRQRVLPQYNLKGANQKP